MRGSQVESPFPSILSYLHVPLLSVSRITSRLNNPWLSMMKSTYFSGIPGSASFRTECQKIGARSRNPQPSMETEMRGQITLELKEIIDRAERVDVGKQGAFREGRGCWLHDAKKQRKCVTSNGVVLKIFHPQSGGLGSACGVPCSLQGGRGKKEAGVRSCSRSLQEKFSPRYG